MYVPSNPHEAYKMGVKQATQPLYVPGEGPLYGGEINQNLAERAKNLLTRPVSGQGE